MEHQVELMRVHKGSPYNCSGYIPSIFNENSEDVINMPEVQKMIDTTYGKKFILTVHINNSIEVLAYTIEKSKAIIL